jgi:hypothetical protein
MQMVNEGDQRTYALEGDVNGIKTGNRVRLSGNKKKADKAFIVTRLSKDYGPCKVAVTP